MSLVRIVKSNGDEHTVTLLTMCTWLADEDSYLDVLGRLVDEGQVVAELKESEEGKTRPATLFYLPSHDASYPSQRSLPLREFAAEAQLLFELPGHIRCRASSEPEARELITEVLHGSRRAPSDFAVTINGEDIDGFIANIDLALSGSQPRALGVQDVTITSITERVDRRLIGSTAS
jgi:hypothetical protein